MCYRYFTRFANTEVKKVESMRALDLIIKKRNGLTLTQEELAFLITGYVNNQIPEYQISAWLMAVYFQGMTPEETSNLTNIMIQSGTVFDLSGLPGPFIDKHSTGGVGDKVSLILAPLVASLGVQIPMMSGRSLGHTGGTLDKLESIPGYQTQLSPNQFRHILGECGFAMTGQSKEVVPADRLLYALRDATGTVESVPLITGSILSKKFAEGAQGLVFDVKTGPGAFMKTLDQSKALAQSLVATGKELGKKVVAVLTRMEEPLGSKVGNFLEVEECIDCMTPGTTQWTAEQTSSGWIYHGPCADLMEVTLRLSGWMLVAGGKAKSIEEAISMGIQALHSGKPLKVFEQNVTLQHGNVKKMYELMGTWRAPESFVLEAPETGFVQSINSFSIGMAGVYLGAGRSKTTDPVEPHVGIEVHRKVGDSVEKGAPLFTLWATNQSTLEEAKRLVTESVRISSSKPELPISRILEEITAL